MKVVVVTGPRAASEAVISRMRQRLAREKPDLVLIGDGRSDPSSDRFAIDLRAEEWCEEHRVESIICRWRRRNETGGPRRNTVLMSTARAYLALGAEVEFLTIGPEAAESN